VDELTFKIMNVHIGTCEDPQPLMLKLQAYREELFAASSCERDEARLTADLKNSLGDKHSVALSIYHQNPLMDLTALQNCVQLSWLRSARNQHRIAKARLSLPVAVPAFTERVKPPSPSGHRVRFQDRGGGLGRDRGGRGGGRGDRDQQDRGSGYNDHGKPKNQKSSTPMFACQLCTQEGHWVSRCPLLQQAALLVAPAMASASPAAPEDGPRACAARISDDDDDGDDNDDNSFEGEYVPLVALAGVRGGPGRNENHPGPRGASGLDAKFRRTRFGPRSQICCAIAVRR
jgi:hypothetical protein